MAGGPDEDAGVEGGSAFGGLLGVGIGEGFVVVGVEADAVGLSVGIDDAVGSGGGVGNEAVCPAVVTAARLFGWQDSFEVVGVLWVLGLSGWILLAA